MLRSLAPDEAAEKRDGGCLRLMSEAPFFEWVPMADPHFEGTEEDLADSPFDPVLSSPAETVGPGERSTSEPSVVKMNGADILSSRR
jgi:hypothetical protein